MKFFAQVVIFICLIQLGLCKLKCYQCTATTRSTKDPCYDPLSASHKELKPSKCSDDLVNKFLDLLKSAVSTEPMTPVCMKVNTRVGTDVIITRQCGMVPKNELLTAERCKSFTHAFSEGVIEYCGVCDKDGCNSAPSLRPSTLLGTMALFLGALLIRMA